MARPASERWEVGALVDLASAGVASSGVLVAVTWSPALGPVLRVRELTGPQVHLVYGETLALLFPASTEPLPLAG